MIAALALCACLAAAPPAEDGKYLAAWAKAIAEAPEALSRAATPRERLEVRMAVDEAHLQYLYAHHDVLAHLGDVAGMQAVDRDIEILDVKLNCQASVAIRMDDAEIGVRP